MYKVTILYEHPAEADVFEKYFKEVHLPLAHQMPGVSSIECTKFSNSGHRGKPDYYRMSELFFSSEEAMQETMGTPEAQATIDDIQNLLVKVNILLGSVE